MTHKQLQQKIVSLTPKEQGLDKFSEYARGYAQAVLDVLALLAEEEV